MGIDLVKGAFPRQGGHGHCVKSTDESGSCRLARTCYISSGESRGQQHAVGMRLGNRYLLRSELAARGHREQKTFEMTQIY